MLTAKLINHQNNNIIGEITYDTNQNACTIALNNDSAKFNQALRVILENVARKFDYNYQIEELSVYNCNEEYYNAVKQELFLKLNISAKVM